MSRKRGYEEDEYGDDDFIRPLQFTRARSPTGYDASSGFTTSARYIPGASLAASRPFVNPRMSGSRRLAAARLLQASGLQPELKFFDTELAGQIDTTGAILTTGGQVNLIPQGDTGSSRDGREVTVKSLYVKISLRLYPGIAAVMSGSAFIYIILDKQCNGAAITDILDVFTDDFLPTAMLNLTNSNRFVVLKHWCIPMNPQAGATTALNSHNVCFDYYKKLDLKLQFSGATGAITEIRSNNIFIAVGSTGVADDAITLTGTCRLRFTG